MNTCSRMCLLMVLAPGVSAAQTISLQDYLALPANPVTITVALGTDTVTQKIIAKAGGRLVLAATDGDTFELNIPPGSLQRDTQVTLRQVQKISHPKLSATANYSSVDISPDGIELGVPATLVFKPRRAFPIGNMTPFAAQANGEHTQLALLAGTPTPREITLGLLHFSNYTISDGPTADEIIGDGISQMLTTRIASWLSRQMLEASRTGDWAGPMDRSFREAFELVVEPSIRAIDSCATGRYAFGNYAVWVRQLRLMGADEEKYFPPAFQATLDSLFTQTATHCFELAKKACYVDHQPIAVLNYAFLFQRTAQLIGAFDVVEQFFDLAAKCSKFKFFMESEIWAGEDRQDSSGVTAKAEFDFSFNPLSEEPIRGKIEVESTYLTMSEFNCAQTSFKSSPADIWIKNFLLQSQTVEEDLTLFIGGLIPESVARFRCVDKQDRKSVVNLSVPGAPVGSWWGGMFIGTHGPTGLNEMDLTTAFFTLKGWQVRHDTKYATKEYTHTVEYLNESTSIIIYHLPDPL